MKSRALAALFACSLAFGLDLSKLKPTGYVNDFAHAFDAQSAQRIEQYCEVLERSTGVQMAVVTVDTLDGDDITDTAQKLYHQWGIGKKGSDQGILILFAVKDHKDRAEIGYGLESVITDADSGEVLRSLRPALRQNLYGQAALSAAQQFGKRIADARSGTSAVDSTGGPDQTEQPGTRVQYAPHQRRSLPWPFILFAIFFLLSMFGRGGRGGGGFTGFLTGMFLGNMMGRGGRGSDWGGGGFGGDSGGGGFGGFGGGDSGGGGASSDW